MKPLTKKQAAELKRDGLLVVGDRIIRTASYCARVKERVDRSIAETARNLLRGKEVKK